jgi:hypothetical protein
MCRAPLFDLDYNEEPSIAPEDFEEVTALIREHDALIASMKSVRSTIEASRNRKKRVIKEELQKELHAPLDILLLNQAIIKGVHQYRQRRMRLQLVRSTIYEWVEAWGLEIDFDWVIDGIDDGQTLEEAWGSYIGFGQ